MGPPFLSRKNPFVQLKNQGGISRCPFAQLGPLEGGFWNILIHPSHSLTAPFGGLCPLLLLLNRWFVIKPPLFDLRKKPFLGQFLFEISQCLFYLIVVNRYFHIFISLDLKRDYVFISHGKNSLFKCCRPRKKQKRHLKTPWRCLYISN